MKQLTVGVFVCLFLVLRVRTACLKYPSKPEVVCSNKILESSDGRFDGKPLCYSPYLRTVGIQNITESRYTSCGEIELFTCESCGQLPSDFFNRMVHLDYLEITNQNISNLTRDYLKPLTMLKYLTLTHSSINNIEDGAFCQSSSLKYLDLSSNNVLCPFTKSIFANCTNVKLLHLADMKNIVVEPHAFSDFINVYHATLVGFKMNPLKKEVIGGLKNAKYLRIVSSEISKIDADCFSDFSNLKSLTISASKLTEIDSELIVHLPKLVVLQLDNSITNIDSITHPTLQHLLVSDNNITDVSPEAIKENFPHLERLAIYGNPITPQKKKALQNYLAPAVKVEVEE